MPNVLLMHPIHPDAEALLRAAPGTTVELAATPEALRDALPRADAILVRIAPVTAAMIDAAPSLRIVARHGVGYDLVDVDALSARGVPLTITPDANAVSVAEHAMMLMLACARRATAYDARVRALRWGTVPELPTFDLDGRTALVLGFGRIGQRVARLCAAFGMRVLVHDPHAPAGAVAAAGHTLAPVLRAALPEADAVSLHLPSTPDTAGMVDAAFLAALRPGAVLVNTARGTLVDEAALADALRSGHLGAAGLDVLAEEPVRAGTPLLEAPNLVLTPHSAAATAQGVRRMSLSAANSILARFAGTLDPSLVVNRDVL